MAAPFKSATTEIIFAKGISKIAEVIELAEENKIIEKKGSWYSYEGQNIAQGKNNLKLILESSKELYEAIYNKVQNILNKNN